MALIFVSQKELVQGVIRDNNGDWVIGYAKNLGFGSNSDAEFWGTKLGLELALRLGFRKLEIEADSSLAINVINGIFIPNAAHKPLITCFRSLIPKFDEVMLTHIYCEAKRGN
ncbi:hypothetical protein SLE2022_031560 [Rubroshorea leprosula]